MIGTYQPSVSKILNGYFLLQPEQLIRISKRAVNEESYLKDIKDQIRRVRIGPNTYLDDIPDGFMDLLFDLRKP